MSGPAWAGKAQRVLVPLASIDLAIQYISGILTNAYAPAAGFTDSTDFGAYDVHSINADVLGILLLTTIIVVALTRDRRNLGMAIGAFVAMLIAAIAGMAFVGGTPNPPTATIVMGLAFLVAFGTLQALGFRVFMSPTARDPPGAPPSATAA